GDPTVPQPLRGYLGQKLDALPWRPVIRGLQEHDLGISGARVKMLRIEAGAGMPQHSHEGTEHTLVLTGSYGDTLGIYRRGDVSTTDASVDHRPLAGTDGPCICLTVVDAPLRLTGPLGRFLNPFVRF
ncbi:MAG: cupin domain-containing protein, partial [Azospirillaceae bacterium]